MVINFMQAERNGHFQIPMNGSHYSRDYLFRNPNDPRDNWNILDFIVASPLALIDKDFTCNLKQASWANFVQVCADLPGTRERFRVRLKS
jgi:hypothetical protein